MPRSFMSNNQEQANKQYPPCYQYNMHSKVKRLDVNSKSYSGLAQSDLYLPSKIFFFWTPLSSIPLSVDVKPQTVELRFYHTFTRAIAMLTFDWKIEEHPSGFTIATTTKNNNKPNANVQAL